LASDSMISVSRCGAGWCFESGGQGGSVAADIDDFAVQRWMSPTKWIRNIMALLRSAAL